MIFSVSNTNFLISKAFILLLFFPLQFLIAQQYAFPNAYGDGAFTSGGRGGAVIHVTNLNDNGAGSFREALSMTIPRTIVFDVSGIIKLKSLLYIDATNSNVTIAGQTAPEGGITIAGNRFYLNNVSNIIVRYIRFKGGVDAATNPNVGDNLGNDSLSAVSSITNQIFDHCSFAFGADESASWYVTQDGNEINGVTIQRCLFAENIKGSIIGKQSGKSGPSPSVSFIFNLFYNSGYRFPNVSGDNGRIDVINNVVWNSMGRLIRGNGSFDLNHIGNYYHFNNFVLKNTSLNVFAFGTIPQIFSDRNKIVAPNASKNIAQLTNTVLEMNADNKLSWKFFQDGGGHLYGDQLPNNYFTNKQHPLLGRNIKILTADESLIEINNSVGCDARLNADGSVSHNKDIMDAAWLDAVKAGTFTNKLSTKQYIVPPITSIIRPLSFYLNNNHIPEIWFAANVPAGQDHNDIAPSGYTWLEEYLNGVDRTNDGVAVNDVKVTPNEADLEIKKTLQITAIFTPANSTNQNGKWTSSDDKVATVDANGLVTAVSVGEVEITFTTADGQKEGTSEITVFPEALQASAGSDQQICKGESATLTASGGTNYVWSTGETTESIKVTPETTTTYTVTISDDDEQSEEASVTVTVNEILVANAGKDQTICKGQSTTLTASGGTSYLWSTGETKASIEVDPSVETIYSVEVSSGNCSSTDEVIIYVTEAPELTVTADLTIEGGESTTLTVAGATSYEWSTGAKGDSITVSPTATTTYTVTGTSNGCETTARVKVTIRNTIGATVSAGEDQNICTNTSTVLTATGGVTYLWNTGATTAEITVSPNETTTYSVTAYNSAGKESGTDEVIVTVNSLPKLNVSKDVTINLGETTVLTATGAASYKWSTGPTSSGITVSPKETTTYTVIGSNNGCEITKTVKVTVVNPVKIIADAGEDQSICEGTSATLKATGGYTYLWNTGATTESVEVSPNATTTYSVTVYDITGKNSDTDEVIVTVNLLPKLNVSKNVTINLGDTTVLKATGAASYKWSTGPTSSGITVSPKETTTYSVIGWNNGCEVTKTVKVTVLNPVKIIADAGEDQSICEGTSTTLKATGGYTYLWSTGATTESIEVSPNATSTYSVTAYDSTGNNSDTDEVIITVNPMPKVDAGIDVTIFLGESTKLTASGAFTYKWNTGATSASITVRPATSRTYTVIGSKNGCEVSSTVKVTVLNPVNVIADAGTDQSICEGTNTTLIATGGATYLWNTGATTESIKVSPTTTTTYKVTVYDSTGNNSDSDEVTVTVKPLPKLNVSKNMTINSGDTAVLLATGAASYKWSTGPTSSGITVSPKATTTYTVTGSNDGCEVSKTVTVTVLNPTVIIANAGEDQSICEGASTTLKATGGYTYLWSTGETTHSIEVSPNATSTYSVTAYDSAGKNPDTDEVKVIVNSLPNLNVSKDVTINLGETTILRATGAASYKWNTGPVSSGLTVSPKTTTTYTVTGSNNGCEVTKSITVTVRAPKKVVASAGDNQDVCQGSNITLTATGGDTYLWSTGAKTASISVSPKSTVKYSVTAYVGEESDTAEVVVYVNPNPDVDIANGSDTAILEGEFITLSATGAKTYKWSNGATQPNIAVRPNKTQTYDVTGYVNDCSSNKSITVNVFEKVVANAGEDVTIYRDETTILRATGPKNSEYLWSTGETTQSIKVSPGEDTEYSVMVYHALDSDTDNVIVKVIDPVDIEIVENSAALEFLIYPNPTDGDLNIKISGLTNLSSIHLYDLSGKSLYNEIINDGDQQNYVKTMDLSNYASGIYLLQLVDNQRVITKKVVLR